MATDIVLLTHNRLDHLEATVDALERHTPEPIRITIVDNASAPDVRSWLAANRARFHQLILRPANEYTAAFQHGIDATTSDPFIVTDPDIVVPELEPSWLARMLGLIDRHPDFGLIGIGLDNANRPAVLDPEVIAPDTVVADEIVETPVGTVMMMLRHGALTSHFSTDWEACRDVALAMARAADTDPAVAVATVEDRERWLTVFAEAAFGPGTRRLWVWQRDQPLAPPERVVSDERAVRSTRSSVACGAPRPSAAWSSGSPACRSSSGARRTPSRRPRA